MNKVLPWICLHDRLLESRIVNAEGRVVAILSTNSAEQNKANAEYIVKLVNALDADTLQTLIEAASEGVASNEQQFHTAKHEAWRNEVRKAIKRCMEIVDET